MFTASKTQRLFFFNGFLIAMLGIWLTGFNTVHWVSYILPAGFLFAALTGFCLGLFSAQWMIRLMGIKD